MIQTLLQNMDVPEHFKVTEKLNRQDLGWLMKNLATRNADHENYGVTMQRIREALHGANPKTKRSIHN